MVDCCHKFDEHFEPTPHKAQTQRSTSTNNNQSQEGNKNQDSTNSANAYLDHQDQLQLPRGLESHTWFADSSASHHVSSNTSNLQYIKSCVGPNKLVIGNGHSLEVQTIGNINFHYCIVFNTSLQLVVLLHVPKITRNIILVSKFVKDNKVYFEFHPNKCFVKSQKSIKVLIEGFLNASGLYCFNTLKMESSRGNL